MEVGFEERLLERFWSMDRSGDELTLCSGTGMKFTDVPVGKLSLFVRSKIWQNAASEELAISVDASATGCALSVAAVVPFV